MKNLTRSAWFFALVAFVFQTSFSQYPSRSDEIQSTEFPWPDGKRVAVSLSFDDGRSSQLENGIPILNEYGIKATFFINPSNVSERLPDWKMVLAEGHEIANHTLSHPCTGNFVWSSDNALEQLTLEDIANELDGANQEIRRLFGVIPRTFAYPCGQKFVGMGSEVKSYVPLVANKFIAGRGWLDEAANDPVRCDLAQILGAELDGLSFPEVELQIEQARKNGHWLVFCGHDIGGPGRQTTLSVTLEALCRYSVDPANGVWIDTIERVATFIQTRRNSE